MVGVPKPNKLPRGTEDPAPSDKSPKMETPISDDRLLSVPNDKGDPCAADKKECYVERRIPSQYATISILGKPKGPTPTATKATAQMNCKLTEEPRTAKTPTKDARLTTYDTHYGGAQKGPSDGSARCKAETAEFKTTRNGDRDLGTHGGRACAHLTLATEPMKQTPQPIGKTPMWGTDRNTVTSRQRLRSLGLSCGRARDSKEEPEGSQRAATDAGEHNLEAANPFHIRERHTSGKHRQPRPKDGTTKGVSAPAGPRASGAPVTMKISDTAERTGKPKERHHIRWEGRCLNVTWAPEQFLHLKLDSPHMMIVVNHESMCEIFDIVVEDTTNPWSWQGEDKLSLERLAAATGCTHNNPTIPGDEEGTNHDPGTAPRSKMSSHAQYTTHPLVLNILNAVVWVLRDTDTIQRVTAQATDLPEVETEESTVIMEFVRYRSHLLISTVDDATSGEGIVAILSKPGRARMGSTASTAAWLHTIENRVEQRASPSSGSKPGRSAHKPQLPYRGNGSGEAKAKMSKGGVQNNVTKSRLRNTDRGTDPPSIGRAGTLSGCGTPGYEARITLTKRPTGGRPRGSETTRPTHDPMAILYTKVLAKGRAIPSQLEEQEGNETDTGVRKKPATTEEVGTPSSEIRWSPNWYSALTQEDATTWLHSVLFGEGESPPRKGKGPVREPSPSDRASVKAHGTRRSQDPDRDRAGRPDSAWGARGCTNYSADSSNSPGSGPTYGKTKTRDAAYPGSQWDSHVREVANGKTQTEDGTTVSWFATVTKSAEHAPLA